MNLGGMCRMAAKYSDRYDEYMKTERQDGTQAYEGEALHWFELFRDAINEAYFEVSRSRLMPTTRVQVKLTPERIIDLSEVEPEVCTVCGVYRIDGVKRDTSKMRLLLRSLARNESTTVTNKT